MCDNYIDNDPKTAMEIVDEDVNFQEDIVEVGGALIDLARGTVTIIKDNEEKKEDEEEEEED